MHPTYTLLDLLTLAARLLAPFVGPLLDEWRAWCEQTATAEPQERPAATPQPTPAETPAPPTPEPVFPGETVPPLTGVPVIVAAACGPIEASESSEPTPPVKQSEPLFVKRGAGKGARYDVAQPDASGERYRRRQRGKRTVYELAEFTPAEADR